MKLIKTALDKAGVITGVVGATINLVILFLSDQWFEERFPAMVFIGLTILVTTIFLTGIYFRAVRRNVVMHFFAILKMGLIITISYILVYETGYFIYIRLDPEAVKKEYVEQFMEHLERSQSVTKEHFDDPEHEEMKKEIQNTTVFDFILGDLNWKFLAGSFSSFIIAVILRNSRI